MHGVVFGKWPLRTVQYEPIAEANLVDNIANICDAGDQNASKIMTEY